MSSSLCFQISYNECTTYLTMQRFLFLWWWWLLKWLSPPATSRTQTQGLRCQVQASAPRTLQHAWPLVPGPQTTPHRGWLSCQGQPGAETRVAQIPTFLKSLMTSSLIWERRTMTLFMKMSLRVAWSRLSRLVWCRTRYQQFTGERRYWSFLWKPRQLKLAPLKLPATQCSTLSPTAALLTLMGPFQTRFIITYLTAGVTETMRKQSSQGHRAVLGPKPRSLTRSPIPSYSPTGCSTCYMYLSLLRGSCLPWS